MSESSNRTVITSILIGWLAAGYVIAADPMTFESPPTQTTLIELFTSEGCSSCPPAEKWLSRFQTNPDLWKGIVPVAFHVDYWDGLGWPDRFARADYTERQRRYAASWHGESVYTPGFVANGQEWRGWFNGSGLPKSNSKVGTLRTTVTGDDVSATFTSESGAPRQLALQVAFLGTNLQSDVKRGENSGRKLVHDFVVLQFSKTEMTADGNRWSGSIHLPVAAGGDKPTAVAVWVSAGDNLAPLQATGGWLKP
jgi:hypothetical protein